MTSTLLKYNVILIVLCTGITLINGVKEKKEIDLYIDRVSPPCRAILLTLEALNLEFNIKIVNILKGEQYEEEFLKMNSLHTVPVLKDGDFILLEGPAIIVYLVQKFGEPNTLYPTNLEEQAQVNQRLHFDNGTLYPAFKNQYNPWIFKGIKKTPEREEIIHKGLRFLEQVLSSSLWVAGNSKTVADFALVASISAFEINGVDLSKYPRINAWLTMCKNELDGYNEANQKGINEVKAVLEKYLNK